MIRGYRALTLLLALVLSLSTPLHAAQAEQNPFAHYQHTKWSLEEGAPSQISSLAQGRDGYLWIGGALGVYRFDGRRFEKFQPVSGDKLREADVYSLLAASNGDIWIGYDDAGVARIREGRVTRFGAADQMEKGTVAMLAEDHEGNIWATQVGDVARYDGRAWTHYGEQQGFPPNTTYYTVFVDREDTVWVSTSAGLFARRKGTKNFNLASADATIVIEFRQAPDGTLWLARNDSKLGRLAVSQGSVTRSFPLLAFSGTGLTFDEHGQLWLGSSSDGVHLASGTPGGTGTSFDANEVASAARFSEEEGLSSKFLWPGLEDAQGNIWFASKAGLDRFRRKDFVTASRVAEAGLVVTGHRDVWAASQRAPIVHLAGEPDARSDVPDHVTTVSSDAQGAGWFAGAKGVWRMEGGKTSFVAPLPAGENLQWAAAIRHDSKGVLWLSTPHVGVSRYGNGAWTAIPGATPFARALMEDADGNMWRSSRGTVLRTDDGKAWTSFGKPQGLDVEDVLVIRQLNDGRIWVGGREGAAVLVNGRFHALSLAGHQPLRGVGAILQSPDGALWFHTMDGVLRIPPAEWQRFLATPAYPVQARHFDFADGLPGQIALSSTPSGVEGPDGTLWFATGNGVVHVDPLHLSQVARPPRVTITSFFADDVAHAPGETIDLPAGTMQVRVGFTALELGFPDRVRFRYRLRGVDTAWHESADQREASYNRPGPGTFHFDVLASTTAGQWSAQPTTLVFHIAPLFWQTVWFRFVCAGAFVLLVAALMLWRLRTLAQRIRLRMDGRLAERVRIARELHDTVLQGFHALLLHMDAATRKLEKDDPARPGLSRSIELARHLLEEGRDRIVRMRAAPLSDARFADELYADLSPLGAARGCAVEVVTEGDERPIALLARDEVRAIALETVCNALLHGAPSVVRVELAFRRKQLVLRVADDGSGATLVDGQPPLKAGRWGVVGMFERAGRLGARLGFDSEPGKGFVTTLSVPASCAYATWWRTWIDRSTGMNSGL